MADRQVATKFRVLDKYDQKRISFDLQKGDELCRGRMIPMSPQLITTVRSIYRKCQLQLQEDDTTPVMEASTWGFADMVWGFIQCSKQTETNIHTGSFFSILDFLWLRDCNGNTALDIAISWNRVEVAKILLSYASCRDLNSVWDSKGKALLPLLHDYPKHDGFIFDMLEAESGQPPIHNEPVNIPAFAERGIQDERKRGEIRKYLEKLDHGLLRSNPDKNTILHIVSKFGEVHHVKKILENDASLISCRNSEGETPVYVAAREGHVYVLSIMLHHLIRNKMDVEQHLIRSKDRHNALHIAIQNHHAPVVLLLLNKTPKLANQENILKESPLYVAAERGFFEIVKLILNKCLDKTFTGPNGTTAVHAAAISNSAECIKYLLQQRPDLVNAKDEDGWSPWRYAVHHNSSLAMKELLKVDHSIGYQLVTQDDTDTSALHIAASRGNWETMLVLMNMCPGSQEFDNKGRNILHVAIENKQYEVTEFIFQDESLTSLINQKDNNGNTPAHLLAKSNIEMLQKVIDSRVDIHSPNNENRTPLDMIYSDEKRDMKASDEKREMIASDEKRDMKASDEKKRDRLIKAIAMGTNMSNEISSCNISVDLYNQELEAKQKIAEAHFKMGDNMVLVNTLIATATFAATFTVPGGFDSDSGSKQGTPYLLTKAAFQVFVIANAIAFSCSFSVLLSHILLLIHRNRYYEASTTDREYIRRRFVIMYLLTGIALLAMLIAIVTGFYVVLLPSLWLAIFVCALIICIVVGSLIV